MNRFAIALRTIVMGASAAVVVTLYPAAGFGQTAGTDADDASGSPQQQASPAADHRYALVKANGDILRIDREAGTISYCRKANGSWRCMPAPLAEEAYLAEIAALSDEISRLSARIRELENTAGGGAGERIPGAAEQAPAAREDRRSGLPAPEGQGAEDGEDPARQLSDEDEEQLDRMLQFSEKAMRRFFGLMRDIQKELDGS
jgi:hypothetical protein